MRDMTVVLEEVVNGNVVVVINDGGMKYIHSTLDLDTQGLIEVSKTLMYDLVKSNIIVSFDNKLEALSKYLYPSGMKKINVLNLKNFTKFTDLTVLEGELGIYNKYNNVNLNRVRPLSYKEINQVVSDLIKRTDSIQAILESDHVKSTINQNMSVITEYLNGNDYYLGEKPSSLAVRALTSNYTVGVEVKDKFNWELNGKNILDEVELPTAWREVINNYTVEIEKSVKDMKSRQGSKRVAAQETVGKVINPTFPVIEMKDGSFIQPSLGGLHTTNQKFVDVQGVSHRDLSGAYGMLAIAMNLYGEATETYKGFMNDKYSSKKALKEASNEEEIKELERKSIAAKLVTNMPTGSADQIGSFIYNPIAIREVRIGLQVVFYELLTKMLEVEGTKILSVNTDGVFYTTTNEAMIDEVANEWSTKWGLLLDFDQVERYIAKSDNDRILIIDGTVAEVSGEFKHLKPSTKTPAVLPRIVDIIAVEKLITNREIIDIMLDYVDQPELFTMTLKGNKNQRLAVENVLVKDSSLRVFLTKEGSNINPYNVYTDKKGSFSNIKTDQKFEVLNSYTTLHSNVDFESYVDLIASKLENWK